VILTPLRVARMLVLERFTGWQVVTLGAIARAESGLDAHAVNVNDHDPEADSYRSCDWGIWQINDYWWQMALTAGGILAVHTPISQQLLRPRLNVRALRFVFDTALFIADGDVKKAYEQWNVYKSGAHVPFMHDARIAANEAGVDV